MKKIIITILCTVSISAFSQTPAQIDSINNQKIDSVYNDRDSYIGQPLSKLFTDLNLSVGFSRPDNLGGLNKQVAYYKNFIVYFPWVSGAHLRGLRITLVNKRYVNTTDYKKKQARDVWDTEMITTLGASIVADIKKY